MATKRKQFAKWSRDAGDASVTFTDGTKKEFFLAELPSEMKAALVWYGTKQKLADSGSDADNLQEFKQAVNDTWESLMQGTFNRQGGGSGKASLETVAEAVSRLTGKDVEYVTGKLREDPERLEKYRKHDAVKAKIAEIYAERLKAKAGDEEIEI